MILARSLVMLLAFALAGCAARETVPQTGRTRPALQYSEAQMTELGAEAYREVESTYATIRGTAGAARVDRVGRRIARASGERYDWEFRLFDDPDTANAFCLPGGKVGVFSGLLEFTEDDDGLAVVLSHEVAHAVLQHSNERMSQPALKQLIGMPVQLGVGVWGAIAPGTRKLVMSTFGLGHVVGEILPYSQKHETEADLVGLEYMQRAGYDLDAAPAFWRRLDEDARRRGQISDAVSTHPDPGKRADQIERRIAEMRAER
jgi:predicted Zn-dependent protease